MKIDLKYIEDIEGAIGYNSASTHGYAERKIKDLLTALLRNESVIIEDIGIEIRTIEEYKKWKKDRDYLNTFNTDALISKIKNNS